MKKKIMMLSIFLTFLLIFLPSLSAIEHKNIEDANKKNLVQKLENEDMKNFNEKNEDSTSEPKCIIISILIILKNIKRILRSVILGTILMPYFIYVLWACILWLIF